MFRAGLLERPTRGIYRITERGKQALKDSKSVIDIQYLKRFPEYHLYIGKSQDQAVQQRATESAETRGNTETAALSPDEAIDQSYLKLRASLSADILARILGCSDKFFEYLVLEVMLALGYGGSRAEAAKQLGRSGDEGIDGVINEDRLGLDSVYLQAKRYAIGNNIGREQIQAFIGALSMRGARKGVFITTSDFTKGAKEAVERANQYKVVLMNGEELAGYMIDHSVGTSLKSIYKIMKIDEDYFEE